jgi:hypothetical protein
LFLNIGQGGVLSHIDSKLLPEKSKHNEDNIDRMESQGLPQGTSMILMQSEGAMANSDMENKSVSPVRKSLVPSTSQKKSNKSKSMQQQSTNMNDDDDDVRDEKQFVQEVSR